MANLKCVGYNPSLTPISGTEQIGDLVIGTTDQQYFSQPGGIRFWATPDLDLGYVVAHVNSGGDQPNPLSVQPTYVGFWRSDYLTTSSFLDLANNISVWDGTPQNFTNPDTAKTWLNTNGYWTSWVSGDTIVESFTTIGTTSWTAPSGITTVEYLVVGGGGGAGNGYDSSGGGGAGGGMVRTGYLTVVPGQSYTVIIGSGGTGGADARTNNNGIAGAPSTFSTITSLGGGYGGGSRTNNPGPAGIGQGLGGAAQVGTTSSGVGGNGGGGGNSGGGGGGAGGAGTNRTNAATAGSGGSGISSSITGSAVIYGGGGNGGTANNGTIDGANGAANTGKGGGAGSSNGTDSSKGGNGGSGIVVLKYLD